MSYALTPAVLSISRSEFGINVECDEGLDCLMISHGDFFTILNMYDDRDLDVQVNNITVKANKVVVEIDQERYVLSVVANRSDGTVVRHTIAF